MLENLDSPRLSFADGNGVGNWYPPHRSRAHLVQVRGIHRKIAARARTNLRHVESLTVARLLRLDRDPMRRCVFISRAPRMLWTFQDRIADLLRRRMMVMMTMMRLTLWKSRIRNFPMGAVKTITNEWPAPLATQVQIA